MRTLCVLSAIVLVAVFALVGWARRVRRERERVIEDWKHHARERHAHPARVSRDGMLTAADLDRAHRRLVRPAARGR